MHGVVQAQTHPAAARASCQCRLRGSECQRVPPCTPVLADHGTGRLVVREEGADGDDVCALTVGNREELDAFLTGLR